MDTMLVVGVVRDEMKQETGRVAYHQRQAATVLGLYARLLVWQHSLAPGHTLLSRGVENPIITRCYRSLFASPIRPTPTVTILSPRKPQTKCPVALANIPATVCGSCQRVSNMIPLATCPLSCQMQRPTSMGQFPGRLKGATRSIGPSCRLHGLSMCGWLKVSLHAPTISPFFSIHKISYSSSNHEAP